MNPEENIKNNIKDLERALRLLEEYTKRTSDIYLEVRNNNSFKSGYIAIFTSILALIFGSVTLFISTSKLKFSDTGFVVIITSALAVVTSALLAYYLREKNFSFSKRGDLVTSCRQLVSLTQLISQYTEHNNVLISELMRFEVNLRLSEAEEKIRAVNKLFPDISDLLRQKKEIPGFHSSTKRVD